MKNKSVWRENTEKAEAFINKRIRLASKPYTQIMDDLFTASMLWREELNNLNTINLFELSDEQIHRKNYVDCLIGYADMILRDAKE